jgi:sec-independent protein translocase protein TatC
MEKEKQDNQLKTMTLLEHLDDLRKSLLRSILIVFSLFLLCWYFSGEIFKFLEKPIKDVLGGKNLAFTQISDPFILYLKVGFFSSIFFSFPYLMLELWIFLSPALYKKEKRYAIPFIFFTVLFFYLGVFFGFYILFPVLVKFFISLGKDFTPIITVKEYFSFLVKILLGTGFSFETPTIMFFLSLIKITSFKFYFKNLKYAILIAFVFSAIITPTPDALTQTVLAVPIIFLYLIGMFSSIFVNYGNKDR